MGFFDGAFGSIAGALLGGASSAIGAKKQYQLEKQQLEWQKQQFQQQMDFTREQSDLQWEREKEMFGMENAYNTPAAMAQRYKEAGLNPQVAMQGDSATAASGGAPVAGAAPAQPAPITPTNPYSGVAEAINSAFSILKLGNEAKKVGIEAGVVKDTAEATVKRANAEAAMAQIDADLKEKYGEQQLTKSLAKVDADISSAVANANYYEALRTLTYAQEVGQKANNEYLIERSKRAKEIVDQEVNQLVENVLKTRAEKEAIPQQVQAQLTSAMAAVISARASGVAAQAAMLNAQTNEWIAHNPNDFGSLLVKAFQEAGFDANWIGEQFKGILKEFGLDSDTIQKTGKVVKHVSKGVKNITDHDKFGGRGFVGARGF